MTHHWHHTTAHKCILIDPDTHKQDYPWAKCPVWDDPITTGWWNPIQTAIKHKTDRMPVSFTGVKTDDNMASLSGGREICGTSHPLPAHKADFTVLMSGNASYLAFESVMCMPIACWPWDMLDCRLSFCPFTLSSCFLNIHTKDTYTVDFI